MVKPFALPADFVVRAGNGVEIGFVFALIAVRFEDGCVAGIQALVRRQIVGNGEIRIETDGFAVGNRIGIVVYLAIRVEIVGYIFRFDVVPTRTCHDVQFFFQHIETEAQKQRVGGAFGMGFPIHLIRCGVPVGGFGDFVAGKGHRVEGNARVVLTAAAVVFGMRVSVFGKDFLRHARNFKFAVQIVFEGQLFFVIVVTAQPAGG